MTPAARLDTVMNAPWWKAGLPALLQLPCDKPVSLVGPPERPLPSLMALARANVVPTIIGLGSAVLVSPDPYGRKRTVEGVVIELVGSGDTMKSRRVLRNRMLGKSEARFVVQCWTYRVCRRLTDLVVVAR